uniref:Uncharacterized protein n=1 Tax=Plectus sambesii TaxID=2011161 RepID=A0A914WE13_9BILA
MGGRVGRDGAHRSSADGRALPPTPPTNGRSRLTRPDRFPPPGPLHTRLTHPRQAARAASTKSSDPIRITAHSTVLRRGGLTAVASVAVWAADRVCSVVAVRAIPQVGASSSWTRLPLEADFQVMAVIIARPLLARSLARLSHCRRVDSLLTGGGRPKLRIDVHRVRVIYAFASGDVFDRLFSALLAINISLAIGRRTATNRCASPSLLAWRWSWSCRGRSRSSLASSLMRRLAKLRHRSFGAAINSRLCPFPGALSGQIDRSTLD